jgi:hypothetical protein
MTVVSHLFTRQTIILGYYHIIILDAITLHFFLRDLQMGNNMRPSQIVEKLR